MGLCPIRSITYRVNEPRQAHRVNDSECMQLLSYIEQEGKHLSILNPLEARLRNFSSTN